MLLETHSTPNVESIWENEWGGKGIFSHGNTQSRGILILMNKQLYKSISNIYKCTQGRYIILDLKQNDQTITLVVIYAPNQDNPSFYQQLGRDLKQRNEQKIIVGDFNLTLDVDLDRKNTYCNNNQASNEVKNLMEEYLLKDIWRDRNEDKREYSWFKKDLASKERKASRIDFALVSGGLDHKVKEIMYLSSIKTDHRAVYLVVEMIENERGVGYWKFNTTLLTNKEFLQFMNMELINTIESLSNKTPKDKWECLKIRIRKAATNFSRQKASQDKIIIANLSEKVNEYEAQLPLTEEEDNLYENTKADLEEKVMERTQGIMFRSKVKWYESGEKSSK